MPASAERLSSDPFGGPVVTMRGFDVNRAAKTMRSILPRFLIAALGVAGLLLIVAMCQTPSLFAHVASPEPTLAPAFLDRSILSGQPCGLPCWMGLTAGVSSVEDIDRAIASLPYVLVGSRSMGRESWFEGKSADWIVFRCRFRPTGPCLTFEFVDGVVVRMTLGLAFDATFRDMVSALGEPSFYFTDRPGLNPRSGVGLFWVNSGVIVVSNWKDLDYCQRAVEKGVSSLEVVTSVQLLSPDLVPHLVDSGVDVPWSGFADQ